MITIILLIAGIVVMILNRVSVSKNSQIVRPNTFIMGAVLILLAIISQINATFLPLGTSASGFILFVVVILIVTGIAMFLLKEPKNVPESTDLSGGNKV